MEKPLEVQHECEGESAAGGTVLVVEDNPEVLAVCISMLEQLGYVVYAVSGALAALDAIKSKNFDLVISDIVTPGGMNGGGCPKGCVSRFL
jgi:CheY-like chemotaxis protein